MDNSAIIALVIKSLRRSASPSANGIHQPDRYQASVTAEDMGNTFKAAGLLPAEFDFHRLAMPPKDSDETWNSIDTEIQNMLAEVLS